jgi:ubiquinone/menaquinone biosynthesis C-methylase UbiE
MSETAKNQCAGPFGAAYDFYIERPRLMQAIGRAVWGADLSLLYRSIEQALAGVRPGATVLDVPCGGGLALRALTPETQVRYIAADLSEKMLARARRRAGERGLAQTEFMRADMTELPFADAQADLFLSYSGLHMIDDAARAVGEIARCLRPGGAVVGTTFVREGTRRQRTLFELGRRRGHALPPAREDVRRWLVEAGVERPQIEGLSGFVTFSGRKRTASDDRRRSARDTANID